MGYIKFVNKKESCILWACLGGLHTAPDPQKQLHSNFFVPNTPAPKTPDPPNPWI
jgi:hypothetical protein